MLNEKGSMPFLLARITSRLYDGAKQFSLYWRADTMAKGEDVYLLQHWMEQYQHRDLAHVDVRDADLSEIALRGANMPYATIAGACFIRGDLTAANLMGVRARSVIFFATALTGANLAQADLTGATLSQSILIRANLREATLVRAAAEDADLTEADLRNADLTETRLLNAKLKGARLAGTYLETADLRGVDFRGATYDRHTAWPKGFQPKRFGMIYADDTAL
jgi:uncharacterized protein YjbI with pentapeptide repeats